MVILAADLPEILFWPTRIDAGEIQRGRNFALCRQIYFKTRYATAGGRQGARVVRFIGYKPGMRRACWRFSWNTDNGWLWRHKTATFAGRHGLTDIGQMKKFFGPRWAYRLQKRIIGEYLEGVVFPSRNAAELNLTQGLPTLLERVRKKEIQEAIAVLETLVVHPSNTNN
jgi:hypothetical protein